MAAGAVFTHTRDITATEHAGAVFTHTRDITATEHAGAVFTHTRGTPVTPIFGSGIRGPQFAQRTIGLDRFFQTPLSALSVFDTVDLTTTGTTAVYTVPATNSAIIVGCVILITSTNTVSGDAIVSVGISPATNNLFDAETLTEVRSVNDVWAFWSDKSTTLSISSGQTLIVDVITAATATTLDARVYVIGIEL